MIATQMNKMNLLNLIIGILHEEIHDLDWEASFLSSGALLGWPHPGHYETMLIDPSRQSDPVVASGNLWMNPRTNCENPPHKFIWGSPPYFIKIDDDLIFSVVKQGVDFSGMTSISVRHLDCDLHNPDSIDNIVDFFKRMKYGKKEN